MLAGARHYVHPIEISGNTILRAAAVDALTNPAGMAAGTFLFIPDILRQNGAGWPNTWGDSQGKPIPAWYGMTTAREENAESRTAVAAALRDLPTLAIIANPADLFSPDSGLYTHPLERGKAWERPASLEMFNSSGHLAFQVNCGLRIHGGTSRQPEESPKHSFRLDFKPRYGAALLHHPLFGSGGAQSFNTLILRAGNNDSWLSSQGVERHRADYIRDEWMRRSLGDMGHPSARGCFVHLYLNGLYWGVYNLCEQPDAALLTGQPTATGFDVIKAGKLEAGDLLAWEHVLGLANSDVRDERTFQAIGQLVDLPELADYLILNYYAGNTDWDRSANWVAIRPRTSGGRFQFLVWDGEGTLGNSGTDTLEFDDDDSPPHLFHQLAENPAFRKLFATRTRQLLFNDGPLSPEKSAKRFRSLAGSVAIGLVAEAARWGTYRHDVNSYKTGPFENYTVEDDWQLEVNRILSQYFPQRKAVFLKQLVGRGLFPQPPSAP